MSSNGRHQRVAKEYILGSQTGDLECRDCGATWWRGTTPPPCPGR